MRRGAAALAVCLAALVQVAGAGQGELQRDGLEDARLGVRVRLAAARTTVQRVLQRLTAATGVRLEPVGARVAQEPVVLADNDVSLRVLMRRIAAQYRSPHDPRYGWFWVRRGQAGATWYELAEDVGAIRAAAAAVARSRGRFARELADRAARERERAQEPGGGPSVLGALPQEVVTRALEGAPQMVSWADSPPPLRAAAQWLLERSGGAGPGTYVEVTAQGAGASLALKVRAVKPGEGGVGAVFRSLTERANRSGVPSAVFGTVADESYPGVLARPVAVPNGEKGIWESAGYPEALLALARHSGAPVMSDEYGYLLGWPARRPLPRGEPLGLWVERLTAHTRSVLSQAETIEVSDLGGALHFRNRGAAGDDLLRPPATTVAWLNRLRHQPGGAVLRLVDVHRLLSETTPDALTYLDLAGSLPAARELNSARSIIRLWSLLTPAQRATLAGRGIGLADLSPPQLADATREGPSAPPVVSATALSTSFKDPVFRMWTAGESLRWVRSGTDSKGRRITREHQAPLRVDSTREVLIVERIAD